MRKRTVVGCAVISAALLWGIPLNSVGEGIPKPESSLENVTVEPSAITTLASHPVISHTSTEKEESLEPEAQEPELSADEFIPYDVPLDTELQKYISELCIQNDVPMELILAMIDHESSYRADVVSKTNDYGLMQINRCNHEWLQEELGISDYLNPKENVRAGIYIIKLHLDKFGDTSMALMAYNLGENGAARLWKKGRYETDYSKTIMKIAECIKSGGGK